MGYSECFEMFYFKACLNNHLFLKNNTVRYIILLLLIDRDVEHVCMYVQYVQYVHYVYELSSYG